jgi:hypothetical protein
MKKVSLGQDIEINDEKMQNYLSNRYKIMLVRLKNWY